MRDLLAQLQKRFGKDVVMLGSQAKVKLPRIPFRLKSLDKIIGGGIPQGRITELYGPENVGKTTLSYRLLASAQKAGGRPVFIDGEGQWDEEWARKQGVDPSNVVWVRPIPAETALETVLDAAKNHAPLVVLDSIASLIPLKATKKGMDQRTPGTVPILMNEMIRKLLLIQRKSPTALVVLNQLREKMNIGRPLYAGFEDTITTPGGRGVKHFVHLRLQVVKAGSISEKYVNKRGRPRTRQLGHYIAVKVEKSKVSRPKLVCEIPFLYKQAFKTKMEAS